MRMLWLPLLVFAGLWAGADCAFAQEAETAVAPPAEADYTFFESRIRPLLVRHCHECHSPEADIVQGGLRLDRAEALADGGDSGPAIVPGIPDESRLIVAVRYDSPDIQMPPAGKLSEAEIADLTAWVASGAAFPPSDEADPTEPAARPEIDFAGYWPRWKRAVSALRRRPIAARSFAALPSI